MNFHCKKCEVAFRQLNLEEKYYVKNSCPNTNIQSSFKQVVCRKVKLTGVTKADNYPVSVVDITTGNTTTTKYYLDSEEISKKNFEQINWR